ncbi:hypothetical protein POM88_011172 [Heracleum sosnowskyi]|uniref:Uncharacterized protein n=1 Tax=Heracleum sosnowskyi TaxID=360622 RepID=A0AAD8N100_9APIA|nr:hypothetical protein POM88_011172 [Heracleum sosnowskyi]
MSQTNWKADKMLDVYIYDYLVKRDFKASAQAFQDEAKVSSDPVTVDAPGGFLFEWWSGFWDSFFARTNEKHSEVVESYIETRLIKTREQQPQQSQHPQHQQLHLQQMLLQRHVQPALEKRHRDGSRVLNGTSDGIAKNDLFTRQITDTANVLAAKMYKGKLKVPLQRDAFDDTAKKQRFGENAGHLMISNNSLIPKSEAAEGQPSGQMLHSTAGGIFPQVLAGNQQLPGSKPDIKIDMKQNFNVSKGITFSEVSSFRASTSKVVCCHLSSDGKLLVTGGHDKKAVVWHTNSLKPKPTLEEHSALITDVRFNPSKPCFATSSFDKTVRVWDADNPGYSLRTFAGHSAWVMSLDFHPVKDDLLCSCDSYGEIRYWSINSGSCAQVFKGGSTYMRFQPRQGRVLAAAADNVVSILDVETQACRHSLKGHTSTIRSVCWDPSGQFLASVSNDYVRVWTLGSGSEGDCIYKLNSDGKIFCSSAFHPTYPSMLVIGCYQSIKLWNMSENKTLTLSAHSGLVASLAASTVNGLVASASHDRFVKLWK